MTRREAERQKREVIESLLRGARAGFTESVAQAINDVNKQAEALARAIGEVSPMEAAESLQKFAAQRFKAFAREMNEG